MPSQPYVVRSGDDLTAYGDPKRWRGIATVNGVKDPASLQPGRTLLLP